MPLESGTYLSDLDPTYPLGGDPTNKGDDHLRLIKSFLVNTFPGVAGNGFAKAIISTEDEINFLTGLTSNAQAQFNALDVRITSLEASLPAPVGTRLSFHQAAAPTGWTQDTTTNDYMMRVVSTAGGASGGTDSPIVNNSTHTHTTGSHVLLVAEMPAHSHLTDGTSGSNKHPVWAGGVDAIIDGQSSTSVGGQDAYYLVNSKTADTGSGAAHNHGSTSSGGTNWTPKYVDMIICAKN